jgi:uncharacterized protein YjbJ (UPF0337 family)
MGPLRCGISIRPLSAVGQTNTTSGSPDVRFSCNTDQISLAEGIDAKCRSRRPPMQPCTGAFLQRCAAMTSIERRTNEEIASLEATVIRYKVANPPSPKGETMDKDRIKGSVRQAKGALKEVVGKVTGDAKLDAEGKSDKIAGKAQNAVGGLKDTLRGK